MHCAWNVVPLHGEKTILLTIIVYGQTRLTIGRDSDCRQSLWGACLAEVAERFGQRLSEGSHYEAECEGWCADGYVRLSVEAVANGALPLPDDLEFKCEYNNIRPLSTLSFMNEDARFLDKVRYSRDDEPVFMQMRDVVNALRAELVKIHIKR